MNDTQRMQNVTVLGAAGKMGSGIVLLAALEMSRLRLLPENHGLPFVLNAVDVSSPALDGLMNYLRTQVQKEAERTVAELRRMYQPRADLVENGEIIDQYVRDTLAVVRPSTALEAARDSALVFEAVSETPDLKVRLLSWIRQHNPHTPWFFSNTSSIPIRELDNQAALDGRILGFHFYNPPAVQKLVELIVGERTRPELAEFAARLARQLGKTVVPANDIAGFIGNGHFMRDLLHAMAEVSRLEPEIGFPAAVYVVDRVSRDFLLRPMGIFQLADYVGLDVCRSILAVMARHIHGETLHSPLLDALTDLGVRGGQHADGSQKDGLFRYEKGQPQAVWQPEQRAYQPLAAVRPAGDERLGPVPDPALNWKTVIKSRDRAAQLAGFFAKLNGMPSAGAKLAVRYGQRSRDIGRQLVTDGVAHTPDDVNAVLLTGFFHAYGPINDYFPGQVNP